MTTVSVITAIATIAFVIMLIIIFTAPKANYGKNDRATGMTYERYKKVNGNGRI